MNRKLHDTALALMVSGALAVLTLVAGGREPGPAATAVTSTVQAGVAAPATPSLRLSASQTGKSGRARRIRHSMAMPFFSFASRG